MQGNDNYKRFLKGDKEAIVEIVKEYKDGLIYYINSFVNDFHTAEDLTEDTFVKLMIKKPRDNGQATFKTWLYTIGRNTALNHLKRKNHFNYAEFDENIAYEESFLEQYLIEEKKLIVHRAINKIKPEYRQVLRLIYFEEFSNKEVAKIMNKSVHNIETLAYRARKALREELINEGYQNEEL